MISRRFFALLVLLAGLFLASTAHATVGCGTDTSGVPTDNTVCGAAGSNAPSPYATEGGSANLTAWCGGSLPGNCTVISACSSSALTPLGTNGAHTKFYVQTGGLSCPGLVAISPASYEDINLNGQTITGCISANRGLRGVHLFNGTVACTISASGNGSVDYEAFGGLSYTQGGGDQILIHHIVTSPPSERGYGFKLDSSGTDTPSGGTWTEYAIKLYNNTFLSVNDPGCPSSCSPRQIAGAYATGPGPTEWFNNNSHCQHFSPVCQELEIYSVNTNASYVHNNLGYCDDLDSAILSQDGCRPVLADGSTNIHIQYNDIWPVSTDGATCQAPNGSGNRGIRLRDATGAEVDHNYIHCFNSAGVHSMDPDIHSGYGQKLNQNIHDNTFEMDAGGAALYGLSQQGVTLNNNTYLCAASGCAGALLLNILNGVINFGGAATINASTKALSEATGNWFLAPSIDAGSNISLTGFSNSANNATWSVSSTPAPPSYTSVTLSDPNNLLVSETCNSGCHWGGLTQATLTGMSAANIGVGLTPTVQLTQAITSVVLNYCGSVSLTQTGSGGTIVSSCGSIAAPTAPAIQMIVRNVVVH